MFEKMCKKLNLTHSELAWVMYDIGNSAFTMLACSLIPIWFKSLAIGEGPGKLTPDQATATYAAAISIVTIIVALLGPIIGAYADHKDRKKIIFSTVVALGTAGCVISGFALNWIVFIVVFVMARIVYAISLTVYDSMLGDITTEERMDLVSSYGYAWGYIGSCIPFLVALIFYILGPDMVGLLGAWPSKFFGCLVTAVWWFFVTVPLLKTYKQTNFTSETKNEISAIFKQIGGTLKRIAVQDKKVLFFLIAFFLYIDGVGTIIDNCINIGTDLGLNTVGQVIFLLATQVVAWLFSLLFAKLSNKISTVNVISICIGGYFCVCLYALTLHSLLGFGILAFGVGMFQGSIQSFSRSYFTKIIPSENSGEYFGIYDIFAKGASFLGSAVIAIAKFNGLSVNVAVALLAFFFLFGFIFLRIADKKPARQ